MGVVQKQKKNCCSIKHVTKIDKMINKSNKKTEREIVKENRLDLKVNIQKLMMAVFYRNKKKRKKNSLEGILGKIMPLI